MLIKLEWLGYRTVKKLWPCVKPFSSGTGTLRTDGRTDRQTDGQTDLLYQYRASVCWRTIKTVESIIIIIISLLKTHVRRTRLHSKNITMKHTRVKYRRIHLSKPTMQQYQQCCHLANGNKTCRSLLLFKNNNVARGSQGFVRQSSRNVALL